MELVGRESAISTPIQTVRSAVRYIGGMAYRLEIKKRDLPPKPYKWEIYEDGKPLFVDRSNRSFSSPSKARDAGIAAIERWRDRAAKKKVVNG